MVLGPLFFLVLIGVVIGIGTIWDRRVENSELPDQAWARYLPVVAAFSYYMILWIIAFSVAGYNTVDGLPTSPVFLWLTSPYFLLMAFLGYTGTIYLFPFVLVLVYGWIWLAMVIAGRRYHKKPVGTTGLPILITVFIFLTAISVYQYIDRRNEILPFEQVEKIDEEVRHWDGYQPFSNNGLLTPLDETPTLVIDSDYPKVDGATAAYPVYGSMVEMVYHGMDKQMVYQYVNFNNTPRAYKCLIDGRVDVIFGVHPSEEQIAEAKAVGKEFVLTPIAREAFIFFVNKTNPVNSLTVGQIQDIYTKKITKWNEVGGDYSRIVPFQRPANSGSQTAMLSMVMRGRELPRPLREEYAKGMGGIIHRVAAYRNYASAIGYSFRYYATGMNKNAGIKLLAIDGIEPTSENIRTAAYPFTAYLYAVTTGNETPNTKRLIEWFLSDQGQRLVEKCGYIPINPTSKDNPDSSKP